MSDRRNERRHNADAKLHRRIRARARGSPTDRSWMAGVAGGKHVALATHHTRGRDTAERAVRHPRIVVPSEVRESKALSVMAGQCFTVHRARGFELLLCAASGHAPVSPRATRASAIHKLCVSLLKNIRKHAFHVKRDRRSTPLHRCIHRPDKPSTSRFT